MGVSSGNRPRSADWARPTDVLGNADAYPCRVQSAAAGQGLWPMPAATIRWANSSGSLTGSSGRHSGL